MPSYTAFPLRHRALSLSDSHCPNPFSVMGMPEPEADLPDHAHAAYAALDISTVDQQQESFETFKDSVVALAQTIWSGTSEHDFSILPLEGGFYTRSVGISRLDANGSPSSRYVLRTPRFYEVGFECCLATLEYVKTIRNIHIPEVVASDESSENALGRPYMVQSRLRGMNLGCLFPGLSHSQKCLVATRLGGIYRQMLGKKEPVAGCLALPSNAASASSSGSGFNTVPFFEKQDLVTSPEKWSSLPIVGLIRSTFEARKVIVGNPEHPEDWIISRHMDAFIKITEHLQANGWFDEVGISLCHSNLQPHHIFADPGARDLSRILTGILGWDDAILGPSFMACAPPSWIWAWQHDEEEDEKTANDTPASTEDQELKALFEEAAGPEYMRFAYAPVYRLARRLVRFALEPMTGDHHVREAAVMFEEWEDIKARGEAGRR